MSDITGIVRGRARPVEGLAALIDPARPPTPEQREIIGAGLAPMLVVAGAGSGKTETLSMRIAYLVDHAERLFGRPISPDEILCLTFTRKAASEIAERAQQRLDRVFGADASRPAPTVATYNAYAAGLASEHALRIGVDPDASVITSAALWQLAVALVDEWEPDLRTESAVSSIVAALPRLASAMRDHGVGASRLREWAVSTLADLEDLPKKDGDEVPGVFTQALDGTVGKLRTLAALADLVETFQKRKSERSLLDFSDQVAIAVQLAPLAAVQAVERSRYRAVLLDEFQDTSPAQIELFARLFGDGHHIMAVGDPNQAIYGFRGASASALKTFVETFGGARTVTQASLSVSWRNEAAILEVANAAAAPLRHTSPVDVAPLRSRGQQLGVAEPRRASAGVTAMMYDDPDAEAAAVARFIRERRAELSPGRDTPASAAVLCRRKAQFPAIIDALIRAGIDYEVVGLGGLIDTPEVADLVALLEVAHDPSRGDSLMRLLTSERVALGPRDLAALADWARHLAGPRASSEAPASIVDALAALPPRGWVSHQDRPLTDVARVRLTALQRVVDAIRMHTYLPLAELIVFSERAWALDIEAAVARPDGRAARNVDAFVDAARSFGSGAEHPTLGAFLAWLEAARAEEAGLEAPVKDPEPGTVQILTVHAAKGLEWDVVAVPGLADGRFPSVSTPSTSTPYYADGGWLTGTGTLPWELRMDRADLPQWGWRDAGDHSSLAETIADYRRDCGVHVLAEERRLFYVALTRARSHVLLSSSWRGTGKRLLAPSLYITELVDAGVLSEDGWAVRPADDTAPIGVAPEVALWPRTVTAAQAARRSLAADVIAVAEMDGPWDPSLPFARELAAMLAEREAARDTSVELPAHVSTSALVSLRRDRVAFAVHLRRPMPVEPTDAAQRGSALHAWIESQYGHVPLMDADDWGPDEEGAGDMTALKATFAASQWAGRVPTDIEVDVEVPIGGVVVRSRIDAVFPASRGLDRITVVDWKSGAPPRNAAERAAREVQLAVYRLAWARWKGLAIDEVDAVFYYVATDTTARPEVLLGESDLEALIAGDAGDAG